MNIYEIRVLGEDGTTSLIASEARLNDSAAIRSAQQLFCGRNFEIWRGMKCIYGFGSTPLIRTRFDLPVNSSP